MSMRSVCSVALAAGLAAFSAAPAALAQSPAAEAAGHGSIGGLWVLNRDKTEPSGRDSGSADQGGGRAEPRDGYRGRRGGVPRGGGGFGRGSGGGLRGGQERDPEQLQAMFNYMRAMNQPAERLTIAPRDGSVTITYGDGTRTTLQTDNKSVDERAENGLVKLKRKSRWDREALVTDIEVDGGPRIARRYELAAGGAELHVITTASGGPGGRRGGGRGDRPAPIFVYERPEP